MTSSVRNVSSIDPQSLLISLTSTAQTASKAPKMSIYPRSPYSENVTSVSQRQP